MEFVLKEWQDTWTPELNERDIGLEVIPKKIRKILTFTGIRRAGKTYIMFQLMNQLSKHHPKEKIFYVNFEDERIERKKENLTALVPSILRLYGGIDGCFLFLDEVQVMPEWGRWLRRLYDNYRSLSLFVSGSSAKVSSREIPTELRGRALNSEVFPLSFSEFLSFKGIELERGFEHSERKLSLVKKSLDEYVTYGGFPEVVLEDAVIIKRRLIQEYFKTIIARDICEKNRIKKPALLHDFLMLLLNTELFSVNKAYNTLRSQNKIAGKETLLHYARYCEDAYFCSLVPVLSPKIKDQMRYPKKVYFADNGFLTVLSLRFSENVGRLYENLVFAELKRRQAKEDFEINYWKSEQDEEVDFAVKQGTRVSQLIQVCYDISDYDTRNREIRALLKASKKLRCRQMLIITNDEDCEETVDGNRIEFIPLWRWLLKARSPR